MIKTKRGVMRLKGTPSELQADAILIVREVGKRIRDEFRPDLAEKILKSFGRDIKFALDLVTDGEFEQYIDEDIKRILERMEAKDAERIPSVPEK